MAIYEVSNPSDPCTIEAPDDATAGIAVLLLGEGAYECVAEGGRALGTVCGFGGGDAELAASLDAIGVAGRGAPGDRVREFVRGRAADVTAALDSVLLCGPDQRPGIASVLGSDAARARAYNAACRSSLNDVAGRAYALAAAIRRAAESGRA